MDKANNAKFFAPKNRRLLISSVAKDEGSKSGVLLPEEYGSKSDKYTLAKVVSIANDCTSFGSHDRGIHVIVDTHMIESIEVLGTKLETVLENYVVGTVVM
jgi:co-chaperonin GroES (HSP10)